MGARGAHAPLPPETPWKVEARRREKKGKEKKGGRRKGGWRKKKRDEPPKGK